MSNSFEKSVKGGTKIKLAPPKAKYVEHILLATQTGEAGVAEVFRTLQNRLRDSTWTIVFKSLIIVHLMIKEGHRDVTLRYLAVAPKTRLAINTFTDVQTQGQNIRRYSDYLLSRAEAFADTKYDHTQPGAIERMKAITIDKGLLRETQVIQGQIRLLLKCDFFSQDQENEIALTAFRLLVKDLLDLYAAMNQAVMNVLSRYFELSKVDAERAIVLYKAFTKQTDQVVQFLSIARSYENVTRLEIPKIKHAPTSLTRSLEEYLEDPDFDTNRRQYLAAQQGRKGTKFEDKSFIAADPKPAKASAPAASKSTSKATEPEKLSAPKGPAPDLIDFFDSIEQNQTPMAQQANQIYQQPAVTGFQPDVQQQQVFAQQQFPQQTANGFQQPPQQTNPFGQFPPQPQQQPLQSQFTGMGFGGYGPQPPQQFVSSNPYQNQSQQMMPQPTGAAPISPQFTAQPQIPQQTNNPFRQSMMVTGQIPNQQTGAIQQQSSNPFARQSQQPPVQNGQMTGGFGQSQPQQFSAPQLQPQMTGTNPFAKLQSPPVAGPDQAAPQMLQPMVTGSTNPFRQSQFINQQTGRGWQTAQQTTMGGWENLETQPVFPRPGQ